MTSSEQDFSGASASDDLLRFALPDVQRRIYCNRTLNLRSIKAIGFDMDYTLIHYHPEQWERLAYEHLQQRLADLGWPVGDLRFDPSLVSLGLVLDLELGNIVKANRFGYVKRASHGTAMLSYEAQKIAYARTVVDLGEPRWVFVNTLFGLSEACMYAQVVDLLDDGKLPAPMTYPDLYRQVRSKLDQAHMEGKLKAEVIDNPDKFVDVDPGLPLAMLDLKHAGKTLLLITNSEWYYTRSMMRHVFDAALPGEMTWRDLFDIVVVRAGKPSFFNSRPAMFEIVDDEKGYLRPVQGDLAKGKAYLGGHAGQIEKHLGLAGEEILYVGDHVFADVKVSKALLRWRTALVMRDLEEEIGSLDAFRARRRDLDAMMEKKERLEHRFSVIRLELQRLEKGYGPQPRATSGELRSMMKALREELVALDNEIAPVARQAGALRSKRWGPLLRAGNDKSHLARQIERYADIYTSRVSNIVAQTPFVYLRSPRGSLPHDLG